MEDNKQKPKKIRGTMEYYYDDQLLFTPQGTGQPQYESLKKSGGGALLRTIGENTGFPVGQLKVPSYTVGQLPSSRRPARPARKVPESPA